MFSYDKNDEKVLDKEINMIGGIARKCLALPQFKKYRDQYIKSEQKILEAMLKTTQSFTSGSFDFTSYGAKMLVYMTRLKDLRLLVDRIKIDSKKGLEDDV